MKVSKKVFLILAMGLLISIIGCALPDKDPTDVEGYGKWIQVNTYYNKIELHWEESYFIHEGIKVNIPDKWGSLTSFPDKKIDFDDLNKHDIKYQYEKRVISYYSGETSIEANFKDLDHEKSKESTAKFQINILDLDIDSKLLIQDKWINDYYFKYDFNTNMNNFIFFKIAKNDINQLKGGNFNEIRLDLVVLTHLDGSTSFKQRNEDGIINVGYYDKVGIYYNPDLS